jgi:DUF4097 and DUF4098 domain-containing protein YvlB
MSKTANSPVQEATMLQQAAGLRIGRHPLAGMCGLSLTIALLLSTWATAETKKEFRYTVGSGATISVVNENGTVTVHPSNGRQVAISATLQSDKVEVDSTQNGNRITARTHVLQKPTPEQARVDLEVSVPQDANVNIDSGVGQIRVENIHGNVTIESDDASVDIAGVSNGAVQIQTINGRVNLTDVKQSRVQISSTGGNVQLTSVNGPRVSVKTTSGNILFVGDFSGGGSYSLMNHNGDIDVRLPSNSSVDLSARSVKGSVENDFPFQKNIHPSFQLSDGRSFAGTSNSGASSVELRSFSGKIRVKKQ